MVRTGLCGEGAQWQDGPSWSESGQFCPTLGCRLERQGRAVPRSVPRKPGEAAQGRGAEGGLGENAYSRALELGPV